MMTPTPRRFAIFFITFLFIGSANASEAFETINTLRDISRGKVNRLIQVCEKGAKIKLSNEFAQINFQPTGKTKNIYPLSLQSRINCTATHCPQYAKLHYLVVEKGFVTYRHVMVSQKLYEKFGRWIDRSKRKPQKFTARSTWVAPEFANAINARPPGCDENGAKMSCKLKPGSLQRALCNGLKIAKQDPEFRSVLPKKQKPNIVDSIPVPTGDNEPNVAQ